MLLFVIIMLVLTIINLFIYQVIRDLCSHINDSLLANDLEIAKLNYRLQQTEIKKNLDI